MRGRFQTIFCLGLYQTNATKDRESERADMDWGVKLKGTMTKPVRCEKVFPKIQPSMYKLRAGGQKRF